MASDSPRRRLPLPSFATMGLLLILVIFGVLLARNGQLGNFLSPDNLRQMLHQGANKAIVALGMLLIIISGGIDLSVGSVTALATVMTMKTYEAVIVATGSMTCASLAAVLTAITTGGLCGLFNGLIISRLKLSPFVTTLGMLGIARGLALVLSDRKKLFFAGATPPWVHTLERSDPYPFFFDPGVWSAVLLAVFVAVLLRYSVLGRHCFAIGSSEATARLCGVPVARRKVMIYTLAGMLTGWAAVLLFAQTTSGDPGGGKDLELEVIAAVVIGGASLSGGRGTVIGAMLGVVLLVVMENLQIFLNLAIEWKYIVIGAVVIVNTALTRWQSTGER